MYYQIVSFNYKSCSLEDRESVAFKSEEEIREFLNLLTKFDFIMEAFVVNTCNRVEIITASKDNFATYHAILGLLSKLKSVNFYKLDKMAKRFTNEDAIEHFFKVVASLDSMVIGEAQITGQVRDGFRLSKNNKSAADELENLLNFATRCAADVRTYTDISSKPISIASVAVSKAEEELESLSGMVGVVIGTGEMGRLASKHLLRAGADVLLISRNKENAISLAKELGENVKVGEFSKIKEYINKYRLLFSATSSKEPIITKEMIEDVNINRLWFDMAIPRDIDSDIQKPNIKIFYIDDLKEIAQNNHALRLEQAVIAEDIVKEHKEEFLKWLQSRSTEPIIKEMRLNILEIVESEVKRAIKKGFIPKEYEDNLRYFAIQLFDKFLHIPTKNIRELSQESKGADIIKAMQQVFEIGQKNQNKG
ncbi:MAG: glutamyl-tRNA reductase [Epsilonproteobacteria bacterium]|nr:glutamyl-tRNA reductase [Campylobacterota bacterium]